MQESKFLLWGEHHRANGWIMRDCLGYIASSKEEAIATCNRNQPQFVIQSITIEEWTQQQQLIQFKLHNLEGIYPF